MLIDDGTMLKQDIFKKSEQQIKVKNSVIENDFKIAKLVLFNYYWMIKKSLKKVLSK